MYHRLHHLLPQTINHGALVERVPVAYLVLSPLSASPTQTACMLLSVIQLTWAFMSTITNALTVMKRLNFNQVAIWKAANSNSDFTMLVGTLTKMSLS